MQIKEYAEFFTITLIVAAPQLASAQGTAFTYQGRLNEAGQVAVGTYDFRFELYDMASGGTLIGGPKTNSATAVSNGVFFVSLDFGAGVFTGANLWLEIGVRTNNGAAFVALAPRQALTPTPYALYAPNAGAASVASAITGNISAGQISGAITSSNLAPGAAAANLAASGHSAVASGGLILAAEDNAALASAGYVRIGSTTLNDAWLQRATNLGPVSRGSHTAVWTGTEMIVWGGYDGSTGYFNSGGRYNPAENRWSPITTAGAPAARTRHSAVWTGQEMIIWGGENFCCDIRFFNDGGRYNPASDTWTSISSENAPLGRTRHTAVWSGSEMIVWGGDNSPPGAIDNQLLTSGQTNPSTGSPAFQGHLNNGGRYNPVTDSWTPLPTIGAPTARYLHTAVWTGNAMLIWGGIDAAGDGGKYNPVTDEWSGVAMLAAPTARYGHTAVWTGTEMIVWGGLNYINGSFVAKSDGGRYNPLTDSWRPVSTNAAPSARYIHTSVWSGEGMIVWAGFGGANTGGRYNPMADMWTATTTIGAPAARAGNSAVWARGEMIVWGGYAGGSNSDGVWSYSPGKVMHLYQRP